LANGENNGKRNKEFYIELAKTIASFVIYPIAIIVVAMYLQMNDNKIETMKEIQSVRLEMKDISAAISLHQFTSKRQDEVVKRLGELEMRQERLEDYLQDYLGKHKRETRK